MGRKRGVALGREDVIQAAIACVDAEGPGALGIKRVAQALAIQPPSLYHHVSNNEELVRLVTIEGWRQLGNALADRPQAATPRAGIEALAWTFRRFVTEHPGWYQVMSETRLPQDDADFIPVATRIMQDFAEALAPFGISGSAVVHTVRMLRASIHGFVLLELSGQFGMPYAADESFQWMVERLVGMLERESRGSSGAA